MYLGSPGTSFTDESFPLNEIQSTLNESRETLNRTSKIIDSGIKVSGKPLNDLNQT